MNLFSRKDGTAIHYDTLGEGYPVVLLHTAFENYSVFETLAKKLVKKFQVVLVDLRGHGFSDRPRHIEFEDFADDIVRLLDYLYIDEAAFICHEMAGLIGSDISVRYSQYVSSLILVNPTSVEGELPKERLFRKYAHVIRSWDEEKQEKYLDKRQSHHPRKMNKLTKHKNDTNEVATKEELKAVKDVFKREGISKIFNRVEVPTLIIAGEYGERTTKLEAKEVADLLPHSHFVVYSDSSVYPFLEEQDQFLNDTQQFIKDHSNEEE